MRRACPRARGAGYARFVTEVTVTVRANGPYKLVGPVTILDPEGRTFVVPEGSGIVLCRCGYSQTKPFCDASHKRHAFVAEDTAPRAD